MSTSTRLEGVDYVLDRSKRTKAFKPTRRKPTIDEMEGMRTLIDQVQRTSDELRAKRTDEDVCAYVSRKLDRRPMKGTERDVLAYIDQAGAEIVAARLPLRPNFYRERFAVELEARRASAPKVKRATVRKPRTVQASTERPQDRRPGALRKADVRRLAEQALKALGHSMPRTQAEAERVLAAVSA